MSSIIMDFGITTIKYAIQIAEICEDKEQILVALNAWLKDIES